MVTAKRGQIVSYRPEAARDILRLQGSNIENREQLLDQLQRATSVLACCGTQNPSRSAAPKCSNTQRVDVLWLSEFTCCVMLHRDAAK